MASVGRAQRRECPPYFRSGSSYQGCEEEAKLPRMFQVRRFSEEVGKSEQRRV